jgi:HD-GYP domain-containing protein (c-di-GMP phosphodiesterase class II)
VSITPTRYGRDLYSGLLEAMTQVMGAAKGYLVHHGPRVALLARALAEEFSLPSTDRARIFFAALLADLGMIGLVEDAWDNPRKVLDEVARSQVREHPSRGARAISTLPYMEEVAELVEAHHEWWDGSGYPRGLKGDDIPLGAQILRVADTAVAMTQDRPHRAALSSLEIRMAIVKGVGVEFGPEVGRRFLHLMDRGDLPPFDQGLFVRAHHQAVEELVPPRVSEMSVEALLGVLGTLIDAKDPYTGGHSRRVAHLASLTAEILGMEERIQRATRAAGHLHDLGKLSVPRRILWKPTPLTSQEFESVKAHTTAGATILEGIPVLRHLSAGARYHHERWDGGGYPTGISGHHIPSIPRILAVCDTYDAMTSGRAYRGPRAHEEAFDEIRRCMNLQFGPREAEAFLEIPSDTFREIRRVARIHEERAFQEVWASEAIAADPRF